MSSRDSLDEILLQYRAELNQGLNELAGHGTAEEQAKQAIRQWALYEKIYEVEQCRQWTSELASGYVPGSATHTQIESKLALFDTRIADLKAKLLKGDIDEPRT